MKLLNYVFLAPLILVNKESKESFVFICPIELELFQVIFECNLEYITLFYLLYIPIHKYTSTCQEPKI